MLFVSICILSFVVFEADRKFSAIACISAAGLAVFLTKYNFGIITLPAIVLTYFFDPADKPHLLTRIKRSVPCAALMLVGILFWLCLIDIQAFIHFFVGHNSYDPLLSRANLFFEINSWFKIYCLNPWLAGLIAVFTVVGGVAYWRLAAARFAILNTLCSFFILALSSTNEDRHFMVALPGIIFLAAIGIFYITQRLSTLRAANLLMLIASLTFLCAFLAKDELQEHVVAGFEGETASTLLYDFITEQTDPNLPILVNGVSDDFGIEALRWMVAKKGRTYYSEVNVDSYPFRKDKNKTARKRKRNVDKPFAQKGFPLTPLKKVIAQNYYKYAVRIKNLKKEQRFKSEAQEFKDLLENYPHHAISLGSREITVYTISSTTTESSAVRIENGSPTGQ